MTARDAWILRRAITGASLNGEAEAVSAPYRRIVGHLAGLPAEARDLAFAGFLAGKDDADRIVEALSGADPSGPAPEAAPAGCGVATLADVARLVASQAWLWRGWIAAGVLNAVASEPGVGKTRLGLDLARRLWFGLSWPDGQENAHPASSKTLWVQGDRNFVEMLQAARDFGLPDEAVLLNAPPDDPTGGLDLDDPDALADLGRRIEASRPALVVLDTVMMTTERNLCRPDESRAFFGPLMELAGRCGVPILGLTHLNASKEALGRRIVEKARAVIKMTCPDPDGQPNRRRLWVDKSAIVKPPALGITMGNGGNDYDFAPPVEPEIHKGGRPPEKLDKAIAFLADKLADADRKGCELIGEWEAGGGAKGTIFNAKRVLEAEGRLVVDD